MKWLKRYDLPNIDGLEGWATIVLTSDGALMAVSDYGSYGFRWCAHGYDDFRKFLLRPERDHDYFLSKLSRRDCWDDEGTLANVKRVILEGRRHGGWSAERAREEWDLLAQHNDFFSREDFTFWYERTSIDCAYELARVVSPPDARAFVTRTLPRLARVLAAELAAERGAAA
jgi:hypothetical protein